MVPRVILLTTENRLQHIGWRALAMGWATCFPDQTVTKIDQPKVIVVDVDLSVIEDVYSVRKWMESNASVGALFLIDTAQRVEKVNAGALGATAILDRDCSDHELRAVVDVMVYGSAGVDASLESTRAVGKGLASAFDDYRRGARLQRRSLDNAVGLALEGVSEDFSTWMSSVQEYHEGTFQHCMLVMGFAAGFAVSLGMRRSDCEALTTAALVHDIGKMDVPLTLLEKPGELTAEEKAIVARHPVAGFNYLKKSSNLSEAVLHAVLHHHEMLDGTGYPHRLSGSDIPDMTRILTICDIAAALSERRSYKPAMREKQVVDILTNMAGAGKLDADIVAAFAAHFPNVVE